jgi:hypothetical protein
VRREKMRRVGIVTALSMLLLALSASVAAAAIIRTINPANAPQGTHFQTGDATCAVGSDGLSVSCTGYELGGVGNTNAVVSLSAEYSAVIDCRNHGGNIVESHETTFDATDTATVRSLKNGRMNVTGRDVSPDLDLAEPCPNPNWTPEFHPGTLTLDSFTYTLTFTGFTGAYITITGP